MGRAVRALLVVADGGLSHLLPLVPLAGHLERAGHEVALAGPASLCAAASTMGLRTFELAAGEVRPLPPSIARGRPIDSVHLARGAVSRYLADAAAVAPALGHLVGTWGADVLVRESAAWAAWLVGEQSGIPVAVFDYAPTPPRLLRALLGDLFDDARRVVGLEPDDTLTSVTGALHLLVGPPRWFPQRAVGPRTQLLCPEPPLGGVDPGVVAWVEGGPDQPLVYVTLGTMFHRSPATFELVCRAIDDLGYRSLLTLGPASDPAAFSLPGPLRRVEGFVSQATESAVIERCDLVVCHGGYGSLVAAFRHGKPVLCLPTRNADDSMRVDGLRRMGAGIVLREPDRTIDGVVGNMRALVDEPRWREASREASAEMHALPAFRTAAASLVGLR